jgi:hypothetical protein
MNIKPNATAFFVSFEPDKNVSIKPKPQIKS